MSVKTKYENELATLRQDFVSRLKLSIAEQNIRTQKELAVLTGTKQPVVQRWLSGDVFPAPENLFLLSKVTGKSIDWFLTGEEPPAPAIQPSPRSQPESNPWLSKLLQDAEVVLTSKNNTLSSALEQNIVSFRHAVDMELDRDELKAQNDRLQAQNELLLTEKQRNEESRTIMESQLKELMTRVQMLEGASKSDQEGKSEKEAM